MHYKTLFSIAASLTISYAAAAQDAQPRSEPTDEVIATGTLQRDVAMSAYLAGDYATAAVEFDRNAFCALRVERNFRAGIESAFDSTIRADVGVDADVAPQPTGGFGGAAATPSAQTSAPTAQINGNNFKKDGSISPRTCESRAFQLYMRGLSELKIGKFAESKASLKQAVSLQKTFHDAYFRLALLEYQDGDLKAAKKNLKLLKRVQKRCRQCEFKKDIAEQVAYLEKTLG